LRQHLALDFGKLDCGSGSVRSGAPGHFDRQALGRFRRDERASCSASIVTAPADAEIEHGTIDGGQINKIIAAAVAEKT
jgi:hypothetical protein